MHNKTTKNGNNDSFKIRLELNFNDFRTKFRMFNLKRELNRNKRKKNVNKTKSKKKRKTDKN